MQIKKLFDYQVPLVAGATILSLGAIIVAAMGSYTAYEVKMSADKVEVTGSAKEAVVADQGRWVINIETKTGTQDQQRGYTVVEQATQKITQYLESQGFSEFETPAISSFPNYTYPQNSEPIFTGFTVSRQIIVRSGEIEKLNILANKIDPFTGVGYTVSTQALELTYSKLDEVRVRLLSEAIKDAKNRAEAIAKESGRSVGALRSAQGGVVQVLPAGGIDISDYGTYDTQSMNKEVMVTVRAVFEL
jgi:uncharacterized protein